MERLVLLLVLMISCAAARAAQPVRVFAAASLTDVLQEAAAQWAARGEPEPSLAFGASSALAKQIDAGAPADVYASADAGWMDWLQREDRIEPGTRVDLLGNSLILVAPKDRPVALRLERGFDLANAVDGKLCTGEPGVVPAGIYAQQALEHFGWWHGVQGRIVGAEDVRTALSFVERGECALGIVYATDARGNPRVVVVGTFPPESHAPIVYAFALVRGARAGSARWLAFLRDDPAARAIFARHGFTLRPH